MVSHLWSHSFTTSVVDSKAWPHVPQNKERAEDIYKSPQDGNKLSFRSFAGFELGLIFSCSSTLLLQWSCHAGRVGKCKVPLYFDLGRGRSPLNFKVLEVLCLLPKTPTVCLTILGNPIGRENEVPSSLGLDLFLFYLQGFLQGYHHMRLFQFILLPTRVMADWLMEKSQQHTLRFQHLPKVGRLRITIPSHSWLVFG